MPPSTSIYSKQCTLCSTPRDVLVRCQIDESGQWHFVCPGRCWKRVSGGVIDGNDTEETKWYRYGGMWKNKHDAVSAKKPKVKNSGETSLEISQRDKAVEDNHGESLEDSPTETVAKDASEEQPQAHDLGIPQWLDNNRKYTKNDKVVYQDAIWICRKSHLSVADGRRPDHAQNLWKLQ